MDSVRAYQSMHYKGGPTGILLLHGFTGTPYIFRDLAKGLERLGYTVSAPLIAGHGTTPEDLEKTTWRDWYKSVALAYDRLADECPDGVFVLGASFGGNLACYLAARKKVKGLILIGMPRWLYKQHLIVPGVWLSTMLRIRFFRKDRRYLNLRQLITGNGALIGKDSVIGETNRSYTKIPIASMRQFFELVDHTGATLLRKIDAPTLIVQSTNDGIVKSSSGTYTFKHLRSAHKELVFINSPHHELHLNKEVRRDIFQEVKSFVVRWE